MENKFYLKIETPCSEDFKSFPSTQNGGFCNLCTKEVIDFTKLSQEEINTYFNSNENDNICGRFKIEQLNTIYEPTYKRKNFLGFLSGIGMACLAFFNSSNLQAQEVKNESGNNKTTTEDNFEQEYFVVKGVISDEIGPLAGANVVIEGTTIGTTTDFDGNFEFSEKIKKGSILLISYVGYNSKKVEITNNESSAKIELQISMKPHEIIMIGKVAKKGVYSSKK